MPPIPAPRISTGNAARMIRRVIGLAVGRAFMVAQVVSRGSWWLDRIGAW